MENGDNIFSRFEKHLLEDYKPSLYFNKIIDNKIFTEYPLNLLRKLKYTEQNKKYHPEGNVWNHTMLVIDEAAKRKNLSGDKTIFMWAALLHDIGKGATTKLRNGRLTSYDHDEAGESLTVQFLEYYTEDRDFINKVSKLTRWHMQPFFVNKDMKFADISTMKKDVSIDEIGLLSLCDRLGRGKMDNDKINEEEKAIDTFLKKASIDDKIKV